MRIEEKAHVTFSSDANIKSGHPVELYLEELVMLARKTNRPGFCFTLLFSPYPHTPTGGDGKHDLDFYGYSLESSFWSPTRLASEAGNHAHLRDEITTFSTVED